MQPYRSSVGSGNELTSCGCTPGKSGCLLQWLVFEAIFYLVYTDLLFMCGEFLGDLYQPVCFVQLAASATFCTEPACMTSWLESRRALAATSAGGHGSPT